MKKSTHAPDPDVSSGTMRGFALRRSPVCKNTKLVCPTCCSIKLWGFILLFVSFILFLSFPLGYCAADLPANVVVAGKNLFPNPGFESDDLSMWVAEGGEMSRTDTPVSNGGYSIWMVQKEGMDEGEYGLIQDITDKAALGYIYTVSGSTRTGASNWDKLAVYLLLNTDTEKNSVFLGSSDFTNASWAQFSYTFMVPEKEEIKKVGLLFRPSFSRTDFYLDDLLLRPSVQVRSSSTEKGNKLSVNIGPLTADQNGLKANLRVHDVRDNNLFTGELNLAEDTLINLKDGFYRAGVEAVDSDGESFAVEKTFCVGDMDEVTGSLIEENRKLTTSSAMSAYHGWLKYLQYLLDDKRERFPDDLEGITDAAYRLDSWIAKIKKNPDLINTLSGVIEWAYLSEVDDSGQPFKLAIPTDYTSNKPFALEVNLHGHGGNHLEYSGGVRSQPGFFHVEVLGRARGGGFSNLSEADVLDAIKYVEKHWNIDRRKIHLVGTSMGGWGTFSLCTRYPHIFASARPQCGSGVMMPIENMLHVPVYSVHSTDDDAVPVLASRTPLRELTEFGGEVVIDETTGLGHAAWSYTEGNTRAFEFAFKQVLPDMKDIRHIRYTAMDGFARRAYWVEVEEWGTQSRPAEFDVNIDEANVLYLDLDNINTLKVDVSQSPINSKKNLKVIVNDEYSMTYNAPLPETLYVKLQDGNWAVWDNPGASAPYRLHYPGGAQLLYKGEPLMIVWGTKADAETNKRMYDAAQAARKSPHPSWPDEKKDPDEGEGVDGIPHNRMLYGMLLGKPDVEVTESDIQKYNLVLIGTAEQNSIVEEIVSKLPVKLGKISVECSDGIKWGLRDAVVGLTYYNPKAPERLIFWIASNNAEFYQPQSEILSDMLSFPVTPDLVVAGLRYEETIASRFFDSRWNWEKGYGESAFCSPHIRNDEQMQKETAKVFIRATGGDMSLIYVSEDSDAPSSYRMGRRRIADLKAQYYYMPLAEMTLSGEKVMAYQEWFEENPNEYGELEFYPQVNKFTLKKDQLYKISVPPYVIWDMVGIIAKQLPDEYKSTDIQAKDVIGKYFPTVKQTHGKRRK